LKAKANKPHYHVTAALIRQDGKLLIARRPAGGHLGGLWEFPGGKQETGETLEACLEREIHEELGVRVKAGPRLTAVAHEYPTRWITLHLFPCVIVAGEPRGLEGQETRWIDPNELRRYTFPPADSEIIEHLEAHQDLAP
jgi:8-oxo-dGTP diphosphatase